jgi:hypothetical protein
LSHIPSLPQNISDTDLWGFLTQTISSPALPSDTNHVSYNIILILMIPIVSLWSPS